MKKVKDLPNLPKELEVDVKNGESGVLIADLPELEIFTEADDLNELFLNINDLIYTHFDIPKKYQDKITFLPNNESIQKLIIISKESKTKKLSQFKVNTYYTEEMCKSIFA